MISLDISFSRCFSFIRNHSHSHFFLSIYSYYIYLSRMQTKLRGEHPTVDCFTPQRICHVTAHCRLFYPCSYRSIFSFFFHTSFILSLFVSLFFLLSVFYACIFYIRYTILRTQSIDHLFSFQIDTIKSE